MERRNFLKIGAVIAVGGIVYIFDQVANDPSCEATSDNFKQFIQDIKVNQRILIIPSEISISGEGQSIYTTPDIALASGCYNLARTLEDNESVVIENGIEFTTQHRDDYIHWLAYFDLKEEDWRFVYQDALPETHRIYKTPPVEARVVAHHLDQGVLRCTSPEGMVLVGKGTFHPQNTS